MRHVMEATEDVMQRLLAVAELKQTRCGDWRQEEHSEDAGLAQSRLVLRDLHEGHQESEFQQLKDTFDAGLTDEQRKLLAIRDHMRQEQDVVGDSTVQQAEAEFIASLIDMQRQQLLEIDRLESRYVNASAEGERERSGWKGYKALVFDIPPEMSADQAWATAAILNEAIGSLGYGLDVGKHNGMIVTVAKNDRKFALKIVGQPPPASSLEEVQNKFEVIKLQLNDSTMWEKVRTSRGMGYRIVKDETNQFIFDTVIHLAGEAGSDYQRLNWVDGEYVTRGELDAMATRAKARAFKYLIEDHIILTGQPATEILGALGVDSQKIKEARQMGK